MNNKIKVCLIGDEFSDRGSNDYFTILILQQLHKAHVNLEINISNHALDFIYAYESGDFLNSGDFEIMPFQAGSIHALRDLIQRYPKLKILDELSTFIDFTYVGSLRLISYDADIQNKKIFIRTHAPCDLPLIREAADHLKIPYNDDTLQNLIDTIDAIQHKISDYIAKSKLTGILQFYPLRLFLWNRNTEIIVDPSMPIRIFRQETLHDFSIHYIHGHTNGITNDYLTNLDTTLGKNQGKPTDYMSPPVITDFHHIGIYKVLRLIV